MGDVTDTMNQVAEEVRRALAAEDPAPFVELLDPEVSWGDPGDPSCRNRNQVMAWYQRGREAGVRGTVLDIEVTGDWLLVSMIVRGRDGASGDGEGALQFQALWIRNGRIAEIVGFDDKVEAMSYIRDRPEDPQRGHHVRHR